MKARDIKSGDKVKVNSLKTPVIAQTIIREEDTDISKTTRKAVMGNILFTYNNCNKVIIPLDEEVEIL